LLLLTGPHYPDEVRSAVTLEQYALSWLAKQPGVSRVLVGMTKEEYVDAALGSTAASRE
jgi:aryl-alcohol dehydrogenase-like predicted oxidoreductase